MGNLLRAAAPSAAGGNAKTAEKKRAAFFRIVSIIPRGGALFILF